MITDDRLYAFIVSHASPSRSQVRRISIHPKSLKLFAALTLVLLGAALYGFYGLLSQARHLRIARENNRLREENERQRHQLDLLKDRVEAVEDASRRLAEMSGLEASAAASGRGAGGPRLPVSADIASIEDTATRLERELHIYETALRERASLPSIWPVQGGEVSDNFGGRRDPFGGSTAEFHSGQDITAPAGTAVVAAGNGTVTFAGYQNGYGNIIIIAHGGGLTTRYAHLSRIEVRTDERVERGKQIGAVGSTGRSTGPHLHYEVRSNDEPVDPRRYLPAE